jgi:signal transduction histidine kinase
MNVSPQRAEEIFQAGLRRERERTDRLFAGLLLAQWALAIAFAMIFSPYAWAGKTWTVHFHVQVAVVFGGVLNALPLALIFMRPGEALTRQVVAVAQMLWSALFIHLTGGRIETHFHVFGSLAFLAFYRDWRLLPTATVVVAADHLVRGFIWPESVYGIVNPEWWRFLEHAGWVAFEDIVLVLGCIRSVNERREIATREASLENVNTTIEREVQEKTAALLTSTSEQRKLEIELRQAQKLEAVGRLAAGVAHEINTPVQFVSDSLHFVQESMDDLTKLIEDYRRCHREVVDGADTGTVTAAVQAAEQKADLEYLLEQVPGAIVRSLDGLSRVATIVRSMKDFAHPDQKEMSSIDLNQAIQSTLVITRTEYKYVAEVETEFVELPRIMCHAGDVNQAILNILINAAHAVGDVVAGTDRKGIIRVETRREGDRVAVFISDTGGGIPEAVRDRIFDPFFTTKEVGEGTGQGLAIARHIILEKHGGDLTFETKTGEGTTFAIRLPIDGRRPQKAAA